MEKKTSLILDIDGTLWDTRELICRGWNRAIAKDGRSHRVATPENIRPLLGKTMAEIADAFFTDVAPELRQDIMDACLEPEHEALVEDPCHVTYPGVAETIRAMARDRDLYIVSNCQDGYVEMFLEKTGLGPMIRDAEWYGRTRACKGESIRILMERNGIQRAMYVGDTQGDLEAAEYAGIPFVWASYGFGSPARWDYRIRSFGELKDLP